MSLARAALASLRQRRPVVALTGLCVALGVMLASALLRLGHEVRASYREQARGAPIVVGAKGSALQLVMSAVYLADDSPGLIPYAAYAELREAPWVRLAIPYALGDAVGGHRVIGTTAALFEGGFEPRPGLPLRLREGRPFRHDEAALARVLDEIRSGAGGGEHAGGAVAEAVVGRAAAERLGLRVGSEIEPTHGVEHAGAHAEGRRWTVVGVLERTSTAIDRGVFITLESFLAVEEHREGGRLEGREGNGLEPAISAVLVFPRSAALAARMLATLNRRPDLQAASPGREVQKLLGVVGGVEQALVAIAGAVVLAGAASIAAALLAAMAGRQREIAVLRALGAPRRGVLLMLVGEATAIAVAGALVGLLLGRALLFVLGPRLEHAFGVDPSPWSWTPAGGEGAQGSLAALPVEPWLVLAAATLGALAGLAPGVKAYRISVAQSLEDTG
ncbi:ABC transporter permease [Sorangium sp. So ce834]|uniref:ABC transporter permease n=1 Tax=Sorangium sp. So ce834 TaxID=3133321 RepID=UPI003F6404BB